MDWLAGLAVEVLSSPVSKGEIHEVAMKYDK